MFKSWNASHTVALVAVLLIAILSGFAIGGAEGAKVIGGYISGGMVLAFFLLLFVGGAAFQSDHESTSK